MNGVSGDFGTTHFKVSHPNVSNNITPMVSGGFQAPFMAGGNQTAYTLGMRSNATTSTEEPNGKMCLCKMTPCKCSAFVELMKKCRK